MLWRARKQSSGNRNDVFSGFQEGAAEAINIRMSFGLQTRSAAILPAATASKLMKTLTGWMLAPAARELLFQFICSCDDQPPRRDRHVEGESPNGVESRAGNAHDDGLTAYGDATTTRCRIASG